MSEANSITPPAPLANGYRAVVRVEACSQSVPAGQIIQARVVVENQSDSVWPATGEHPVRLSYHWLRGSPPARTEGVRLDLPHDLAPGEAVTLDGTIPAPRAAGTYTLEFDPVHELVTWFQHRGSPVARVPVEVTSPVQTTPDGRKFILPPSDILIRSTGHNVAEWYERSGRQSFEEFAAVLAAHGRPIDQFDAVFDFGCGSGRILRVLCDRLPGKQLYASDQDADAVGWLRQHYRQVQFAVNDRLPPLPFAAGGFDLVIAFSVFSHLDEHYQDAWLAELHRVTRPGAFLLLTVQGRGNWEKTVQSFPKLAQSAELPRLRAELESRGFAFWDGEGWESHFPDFYHTTWHLPGYLHSHWSRWFRVLDVVSRGALGDQDIVVLRRE